MVKVRNHLTGSLVVELQHPRWIQMLAFSPDGSELISGCSDGLVRSWDWRTGKLKRGLPHAPSWIFSFDFTADHRRLVTVGSAYLQVTDWRSGAPLGPEWRLRDTITWGVVVPAEDRRAIVGGFSGTVVGYDLEKMMTPTSAPAEELIRLAEVVAGRRIMNQGSVVPITSTEWTDRWEELRRNGWPRQSIRP